MPAWGNTDSIYDKPHFPQKRQARRVATLVTANATTAGNTIVFTGVGAATAANVGVVAGMFVYSSNANVSLSGEADFFGSNNKVLSVTGNLVILTANVSGAVASGSSVDFAVPVVYNNPVTANAFGDTILVTPSRLANANVTLAKFGDVNVGWNYIIKKVNSDGTVRFLKETLVCLANCAASNATSGNTTSGGQLFGGV